MNKLLLVVQLLLIAAVCGVVVPDEQKTVSFNLDDEWTLIPGDDDRLYLMHRSELFDSDGELKFETAVEDVKFILYTKKKRDGLEITEDPKATLDAVGFRPAMSIRFVIHGWKNDKDSKVNYLIRDAFLDTGDYLVIVIDWSANAKYNYIHARSCVCSVGKMVARFIDDVLVKGAGASYSNINIIGHSLGAHIAGIAGKNTNQLVRACIGLDPASSGFWISAPKGRIGRGDAEYVEIIHTSSVLGFISSIGTIDFYPNNGRKQNGCGLSSSCSHSRAYEYFAESIRDRNAFRGVKKNGVVAFMGGEPSNAGLGLTGIYYLNTNAESPFGQK